MVQLLLGFLLFSGGTIDFLHDQVVRLPASRRNLSWGAMACRCSCSAGVLPMDTGDKNSLRKLLQLCGLAGFSFFPPSKCWLARKFWVVLSLLGWGWTGVSFFFFLFLCLCLFFPDMFSPLALSCFFFFSFDISLVKQNLAPGVF